MSVAGDAAQTIFANYAKDVEKHWKNKEKQRREFLFTSPQLTYRIHLVEWLKNVCEKIKVSYRTVHLAVFILDMFMDKHSIEKDRLGFVALVCLMLAAKFEEVDTKIPKISELNKFDGFRYTNKDFIKIEGMVLTFLDFGLAQPTIAHFSEYYAMFTITHEDLKKLNYSLRQLAEISYSLTAELLDICLKEVSFIPHPPSRVAAACILVTRRRMGLTPAWTSVLAEVTCYAEEAILPCSNMLLRKLQQERKKEKNLQSPDHGKLQQESLKKEKNLQSPDHGYISDKTP